MDENSKTLSLNLSTSLRQDLRAFNNSDLLNSPESFDYLLHKIFEVLMTIPNKASKNDISKEMQGYIQFITHFLV